jgi:hypothetical protein
MKTCYKFFLSVLFQAFLYEGFFVLQKERKKNCKNNVVLVGRGTVEVHGSIETFSLSEYFFFQFLLLVLFFFFFSVSSS